nr:transcription elongation factor GreA [Spirochaeta sp.]
GRIREISGDTITIDFAKKRGHSMSLKMAVSALDVLPKDHIWVLRAGVNREKLRKQVKENIVWTLKTVIRSLGNAADMKKIKAELVPAILTPGEWSSWSTKARDFLKTNPDFGTLPDKADHFVVRDQPISFQEKTFNKFKADKTFFDRVKTLEEFLEKAGDDPSSEGLDSEFFREMFEYFANYLRNVGVVNEYVVSSAFVVQQIVERFPFMRSNLELDFAALYEQIEDVEDVFSRIESTDLRKKFLAQVRRIDPNWGDVYARLLPIYRSRDMLLELERNGKRQRSLDFFNRTYETYRDMRETFVWLVKNCEDDPWFSEVGITEERRLIAMVHIFDLTFRDIDNKKDVSYNRKINKQVQSYLFKEKRLPDFVDTADEESVSRIFTLISDVKEMDQKQLLELRTKVTERFPDFHFYGEDVVEQSTKKILFCTPQRYEDKQAEYKHLQEVEVPQNSKEIETAREYGDLKENAEYKAAKERQDSLNTRAARIKTELEQARIVNPRDVNTNEVAFGTKVYMKDLLNGGDLVYSIMGPWESNPEKNVINYQSPLGNRLLHSTAGTELDFEINETRYHATIEKIELAEFP